MQDEHNVKESLTRNFQSVIDTLVRVNKLGARAKDTKANVSAVVNAGNLGYPPQCSVSVSDEEKGYTLSSALDLEGTADRMARALIEMTSGYGEEPVEVLKTFPAHSRGIVVERDIPFSSLCSHHLMPFSGTVDIAYETDGSLVFGASKLARAVDILSRRLQLQENLGSELVNSILKALRLGYADLKIISINERIHSESSMDVLKQQAVKVDNFQKSLEASLMDSAILVRIKASHTCMGCRGIKAVGASYTTVNSYGDRERIKMLMEALR